MIEISSDRHLSKKIRYGRMLAATDLIGPDGTPIDCQAGQYLKIVDRDQDLVEIVEQILAGDQWKYCCVFPKREK